MSICATCCSRHRPAFSTANYLPAGGHAGSLSLGGGATWLINRHMRLSATYDFTDQHGSSSPTLQTTGNYTRSIGLLTLHLGI